MDLGMRRAFSGNDAEFAPMADEPVYVSEVLHKTFLNLDEKGTEAAAATVVQMLVGGGPPRTPPPEVFVDRPFLFAIQDRLSGACLFLGRVVDPR